MCSHLFLLQPRNLHTMHVDDQSAPIYYTAEFHSLIRAMRLITVTSLFFNTLSLKKK